LPLSCIYANASLRVRANHGWSEGLCLPLA
jgi:hypothetical protein